MTPSISREDLLTADLYRFFSQAFRYPNVTALREFLQDLSDVWPESRDLLQHLGTEDTLSALYMPLMKGEIPLSRVGYTLQVAADLQGLYRVFGVQPRGGENPDALPVILEFAAILKLKEVMAPHPEVREITAAGYRKLLQDLIRWLPQFQERVERGLPESFYAACARSLVRVVRREAQRCGIPES